MLLFQAFGFVFLVLFCTVGLIFWEAYVDDDEWRLIVSKKQFLYKHDQ